MVTRQENEILTQTDPGTPMGEVMRRYWVPALLTSEIPEADGPPVRVRLLGEQLIAFRDTNGRIGLLEEFCAHRLASLFLGRNEECGLRCVYHGWKYDVDGNCVDMMNEPPETDYKTKIKLTAYPVLELAGIVWAYMGPKDRVPVPPKFEWTQVAETHRQVSKNWQECNWLQGLEGGIDTAHAPILHRTISESTTRAGISQSSGFVTGGVPTLEVDHTDYGYRYVGIRNLGEQGSFVRAYHYVMPFTQIRPQQYGFKGQPPRTIIAGHIWVPMDDENCMVYNWSYNFGGKELTQAEREERALGRAPGNLMPDFRSIRNKHNDWLIDRQVQKNETFTGIEGINNQDQAVQESMGPIVDRSKESLSNSDMAIVHARRLLLEAANTVTDGGDPPGVGPSYYNLRAIDRVLPAGAKWRDELMAEMYPG